MTITSSKSVLKDQVSNSGKSAKSKGGAPRKKIKRASGIRVRLTAAERFLIESKARDAGMRISDWFRSAALRAKVLARMNAEDRRILHLLAGMANNLNQLTKQANTNGIISIAIKCGRLLSEIDQILKYLNRHDG